MQRDLERLTAENRELKRQLEAWQTYYASHPQSGPSPVGGAAAQVVTSSGATPGQVSQVSQSTPPAQPAAAVVASKPAPTMKVYKVQSGDTPIAIARKYGVKLEALLAANPDLDPKRMKVNQPVNIPTP
jgi:LysM repeat protein